MSDIQRIIECEYRAEQKAFERKAVNSVRKLAKGAFLREALDPKTGDNLLLICKGTSERQLPAVDRLVNNLGLYEAARFIVSETHCAVSALLSQKL